MRSRILTTMVVGVSVFTGYAVDSQAKGSSAGFRVAIVSDTTAGKSQSHQQAAVTLAKVACKQQKRILNNGKASSSINVYFAGQKRGRLDAPEHSKRSCGEALLSSWQMEMQFRILNGRRITYRRIAEGQELQKRLFRAFSRASVLGARSDKLVRLDIHVVREQRSFNPRTNRTIGQQLSRQRGWVGEQWRCIDSLWGGRESGWDHTNWYGKWNGSPWKPGIAYGIPQALPGSKMASVAADWKWNAVTQIKWGFGYISGRYGNPCSALAHSLAHNWY